MTISPNFSGNFFFRTSKLSQLKINPADIEERVAIRIDADDPESPIFGYAIHVQPEQDQLVRTILESDPEKVELVHFEADDKTDLKNANPLQEWANAAHSMHLDAIAQDSFINAVEATLNELDMTAEDDSN